MASRQFLENDLKGWTLENLTISADRTRLTLTVRQPYTEKVALAIFDVFAECCSETWIEYAEVPELPAIITGFERLGEDAHQEVKGDVGFWRSRYQMLIQTTAGTVSVEYRNDSNGYYGGDLEFTGLAPSIQLC